MVFATIGVAETIVLVVVAAALALPVVRKALGR